MSKISKLTLFFNIWIQLIVENVPIHIFLKYFCNVKIEFFLKYLHSFDSQKWVLHQMFAFNNWASLWKFKYVWVLKKSKVNITSNIWLNHSTVENVPTEFSSNICIQSFNHLKMSQLIFFSKICVHSSVENVKNKFFWFIHLSFENVRTEFYFKYFHSY